MCHVPEYDAKFLAALAAIDASRVPARIAHVDVSAQRGDPAARDGAQDRVLIR
jgi:hypothetical protein